MKKKIVIDARMINDSGVGTYIKNIIPYLISKFDVILIGKKTELLMFENNEKNNIINFQSKIYSLKEQILYPFIIPKCDIFWSPHFNAPLLPIKAKKTITTIHDVNHLAFENDFSFLKKKYAKTLFLNAIRISDKVITVSNFSKKEIIKYLKPKKELIEVIYSGVNKAFYNEKDLNFLPELPKKYILYVGNVKPHKNLITLFKAYNNLPPIIKDEYDLVILGKKDGFITPDLNVFKFIETKDLINKIYFTGFIEDKFVPNIYKNATIFVFPSLYEGFGLPILEAMASKTMVLSSNFASLPEVGGENVLYFNPNDEIELTSKIVKTLSNSELRGVFSKKGYEYSKKFSWINTAEKHMDLFQNL